MIIEANNKKQTAVVIFVYENDGISKLGDGFTKWNKLINKIKR